MVVLGSLGTILNFLTDKRKMDFLEDLDEFMENDEMWDAIPDEYADFDAEDDADEDLDSEWSADLWDQWQDDIRNVFGD